MLDFTGNNQITNTPVRRFDWNGNGLQGFMPFDGYGIMVNEGKLGSKDFCHINALASNGNGGFTTFVSSWSSSQQALFDTHTN